MPVQPYLDAQICNDNNRRAGLQVLDVLRGQGTQYQVDRKELDALQPVRAPIAGDLSGDEDSQQYCEHQALAEKKIHWLGSKDQTCENQQRRDEQRDLPARVRIEAPICCAARTVFAPRSFSKTIPSWSSTNVITPELPYNAGVAINPKPPIMRRPLCNFVRRRRHPCPAKSRRGINSRGRAPACRTSSGSPRRPPEQSAGRTDFPASRALASTVLSRLKIDSRPAQQNSNLAAYITG